MTRRGCAIAALAVVAPACLVEDDEAAEPDASAVTPTVTYADDVAPLLEQHCRSCHQLGGPAPFSLETYENARSRSAAIKDSVVSKRMPHGTGSHPEQRPRIRGAGNGSRLLTNL